MRSMLIHLIAFMVPWPALAQQHVIRNGSNPRATGMVNLLCLSQVSMNPQPGDPCDVLVYSVTETDSLIKGAEDTSALTCKQNIETAKSELSKEINGLPDSAAFEALKAQLKDEIAAEVLKEVRDELKAGKLNSEGVAKGGSHSHP